MSLERRTVLRGLTAAAAAAALPDSIRQALAIQPNVVTGTLQDVQHIVVLMQENRSFDHYFGTLRGVRGFSDPRAVTLSTGNTVFYQPNVNTAGKQLSPAYILPYHPNTTLGVSFLEDLAHGWSDAHSAWNSGNNDRWVPYKTSASMVYNTRSDIPFHYALADAFTICDAYHCSIMSSTDPNRYYAWTGWVGQNGTQPDTLTTQTPGATAGSFTLQTNGNGATPGGPVITNAEQGYSWITYPERLQAAGISWKIYQDMGGTSLSATNSWGWTSNHYIGNYGDTAVLYFNSYRTAVAGSALYNRALTGTNVSANSFNNGTLFDLLKADVLANTLPQVSWISAPEAYSEHGNWPSSYGAWYVANVLAALTANPAVWASTVLLYCFDENDGFFDHLVAPSPPASAAQGLSTVSTVNEIYPGKGASFPAGPYGMGARVPMLVISPWSKGGYVCSQTFDHTSIIRFIEARFGVLEPNITPWRRAVSGDLTAAFDFFAADATVPVLPATASYAPPAADISGNKTYASYVPPVPATQTVPVQETGSRPARALPYQLQADGTVGSGSFTLSFANRGATNVPYPVGGWFHVRTAPGKTATQGGGSGPWGYTVEAGKTLAATWTLPASKAYDLSVHSHNGFFRRFAGSAAGGTAASLTVACVYDTAGGGITVTITNAGTAATTASIRDQYTGTTQTQALAAGGSFQTVWTLAASSSWYDFTITASTDATFLRRYAGHVETGKVSISDPLM